MSKEVVIVAYARTPLGSFMGSLSSIPATRLGANAITGALSQIDISKSDIDQVIMGNVLSAGLGQSPARQSAMFADLPDSVETFTINKVCGSGLKAIMLAQQSILLGEAEIVVAGGMENMSKCPHYMFSNRDGLRLGDGKLVDGIIKDGLWDVYNQKHMGNCAEVCAEKYNFSRIEQDDYAERSYMRAQLSQSKGLFKREIVSVAVPQKRSEDLIVDKDEEPSRVDFQKMRKLKSVFIKDGTITAANASTINDGAAAVVVMSKDKANSMGIKPIARIVSHASVAGPPLWFTTAPVQAMKRVAKKSGLNISDINLFEINEAFSVVPMFAEKELSLNGDNVNIFGGAISMGHPIGASGARIVCTLLNGMNYKKTKYGMASICIGGGEASAMILENLI